jgi:hypothetical protein
MQWDDFPIMVNGPLPTADFVPVAGRARRFRNLARTQSRLPTNAGKAIGSPGNRSNFS